MNYENVLKVSKNKISDIQQQRYSQGKTTETIQYSNLEKVILASSDLNCLNCLNFLLMFTQPIKALRMFEQGDSSNERNERLLLVHLSRNVTVK